MKPGNVVKIFNDYQNEKDSLGKATLIEKLEDGLTFYSDEDLDKKNPTLYKSEKWKVLFSWGEKIVNIRVALYSGKSMKKKSDLTTYTSKYDISSNEEESTLGDI